MKIEIEEKLERLWTLQGGINPETGQAWLTPRMERDAKLLEEQLKMTDQAKLNRERVNRFRQHMKAAGFRQRNVYVHDDDWAHIKEYLSLIRKYRQAKK